MYLVAHMSRHVYFLFSAIKGSKVTYIRYPFVFCFIPPILYQFRDLPHSFFVAALYPAVYFYHKYPCLLLYGYLGGSQCFAGINNAAKTNLVQMYFQINIIFILSKQLNSNFLQVVFDGENFRVIYVLTCFSSFG